MGARIIGYIFVFIGALIAFMVIVLEAIVQGGGSRPLFRSLDDFLMFVLLAAFAAVPLLIGAYILRHSRR